MPELPEIETLARGLRTTVQGKIIKRIIVQAGNSAKGWKGSPYELRRYVYGKKIIAIHRRGKWLILELSSGYSFIIHLKMTGQLLFKKKGQPFFLGGHTMNGPQPSYPNNHTRVIFEFTDTSQLYFQDMRKFGYVELYNAQQTEKYFHTKKLALEPLATDYTFKYFISQLQRRSKTTIKAALLDQTVVAGIGNIYADDILFMAKVLPTRRVSSLRENELRAIYRASKVILRRAIAAGGTSFSHYFQLDGKLGGYWKKRLAYQRTGEPCRRCGTPIEKIRVAGRGTHYCPTCQA